MGDFLDSDYVVVGAAADGESPLWAKLPAATQPPVAVSTGNTAANPASSSWTSIGQTLVSGLVSGILRPSAPKPTTILAPASSSGISTGLVVGGVAAAALLVVLFVRRRSA